MSRISERVLRRLLGVKYQIRKERALRRKIDQLQGLGIGLSPVSYSIELAKLYDALPRDIIALEPFGMCGLRKTMDYANICLSIDLFEINESFASEAKQQLPLARVHVKDSIDAVRTGDLPRADYTFVNVDNPAGLFSTYCEHFDLFPELYRYLGEDAFLIINVQLDQWVSGVAANHEEFRRRFYGGQLKTAHAAIEHYRQLADSNGFDTLFSAIVPHSGKMMYVLQRLRKYPQSNAL